MKPKVAFFDFTSCEGCQLDALNVSPGELLDLLAAVEIVNFREVKTIREDNYDIALIEGSVTTEGEIERIKKIRERAKILIALGACACIGGVNALKNHLPMDEAMKIVYGDAAKYYNTIPARPVNAVVKVDYYVRGCPPQPAELYKVLRALLMGKKPEIPNYPVCVGCKIAGNICVFERGMTCMGPVTHAGCDAICITAGRHCWGCRGLVDDPNTDSEKDILKKYGLTPQQIIEKFNIYNTYSEVAK
ncbi:MAG TPA: NADH:ubiquinone oxidoreductase [Dehalococcoidia bacterium]|nr:NADH:ubiquinone oxidoreductase [Dehalococcoidia bacterium]